MKFTKEYIREADCEEIQGLKPNLLQKGDWYSCSGIIDVSDIEQDKLNVTRWLPLSHQLDELIEERINKNCVYRYYEIKGVPIDSGKIYTVEIYSTDSDEVLFSIDEYSNPLIAKIKLLKELLKETK